MELRASAIICAVRSHGEAGAIARALTAEAGLVAGYVRGGRSRTMRPVLMPGNIVRGHWRARTAEQLPSLTVELEHSRAPLFGEPLAAAGIDWATALAAAALPELHPYPAIHSALGGLLDAIEAAPSARGWAAALSSHEALVLAALGYGGSPRSDGSWDGTLAALKATGSALERHVFDGRRHAIFETRARLVERLERAAG